MAKINVNKDLMKLENGEYAGTINKVLMCNSGKIMLKIALEDGTFFVSFHDEEKFGDYPFNHLFMAIDSDDIDDLIGLDVEFTIKNNKSKKTGAVFSNIKKIWIAE